MRSRIVHIAATSVAKTALGPGRVGTASPNAVRIARLAVWAAAVAVFAVVVAYYVKRANGYDLSIITTGIAGFLHHENVYRSSGYGRYLHPPSSLLLLAPLGLLSFDQVRVPYLVLETVALMTGVVLSLRLVRVPVLSVRGGVALLLAGISGPVIEELRWSNVDGLVLPMVVGALIAIDRRRHTTAGVLLGLALAFKPTAVPLLLIPLLWSRWRTLVFALAIPAALFVAGSVLLVRPLDFITVTVPVLLSGLGHDLIGGNISLAAVGAWLHVPGVITAAIRVVVLAIAAFAVVRARDSVTQRTDSLLLLTGLVLVTSDLVPAYAYIRYLIYLVPVVAWLLLVQRGAPRLIGAVALCCWLVPYSPALDAQHWWLLQLDLFRFSTGAVLLFAALTTAALRSSRQVVAAQAEAA